MGHIAAGVGRDYGDDDDDDYSGLSFDETVRRVKEKGEREKYSEAKVTDLLTKIVMEDFVLYHLQKPKREYLWDKESGEFADPLGRIDYPKKTATRSRATVLKKPADAPKIGTKRPLSQCRGEEEGGGGGGGEREGEKRPRKVTTMEKKPTKKPNVEKKQKKKEKTSDDEPSKRFNFAALGLDPPPGLPEDLKTIVEEKGGTDTTLVIMKQLFKTDMSKHHDRFSMPLSQMREGLKFLRVDERTLLEKSEGNKKKYVPVTLLEPGPDHKEKYGLALRQWNSNCKCFVITKWNEVVQNNNLKVDDILQLWSFRVGEDLRFAMVKVMNREEARHRARAAGNREQLETADGAASSSHGGDHASGGDNGATTSLSGDKAMEEDTEPLYVCPNTDQEDGGGATAKAGGQEHD